MIRRVLPFWMFLAFAACAVGACSCQPKPLGTPKVTAPATVTAGKSGYTASVAVTGATSYLWTISNGTLTAGTTSANITFTAGAVGTLELTCAVADSKSLQAATATVNVVGPPAAPVIRVFANSSAIPVATQGRAGLTAFVDPVAGSTNAWTLTGATLTSSATGDSVTYTAGTGPGVLLSATQTNAAGDVSPPGTATQPLVGSGVALIAGQVGGAGNLDGVGTAARLGFPAGVAVAADGTTYVLDQDSATIRTISLSGAVAHFAGGAWELLADGGRVTHLDGTGADAGFTQLTAITIGPSGSIYVADGQRVRKVSSDAGVTTLAGSGAFGSGDGTLAGATFGILAGIATNSLENVFVTDSWFGTVREISGANTSTVITALGNPQGIAVSADGGLFVAVPALCNIEQVPSGALLTDGGCGDLDGPGSIAQLGGPFDLSFGGANTFLAADSVNADLRSASLGGDGGWTFGTVASGVIGARGVAFNPATGALVVAQPDLEIVSSTQQDGGLSVLAGLWPHAGNSDGDAGQSTFTMFGAGSAAADPTTGSIYVSDSLDNAIRVIHFDATGAAQVSTLFGANALGGFQDGPLGQALASTPMGVAVDTTGALWMVDHGNSAVRVVSADPLGGQQLTTVLGGTAACGGGYDGVGGDAGLCLPSGIALGASGAVFVSDTQNHVIRKLVPSGQGAAYASTTVAGTGACGNGDGTGTDAGLCAPIGLAFDMSGTLYVADTGNNAIRTVSSAGVVTTIAGLANARCGSNDGTGAANIGLCQPQGLAMIGGALFVADTGNGTVRQLTVSAGQWTSTTILGHAGQHGTVVGSIPGTTLNGPTSLAATATGDLIVVDANENSVLLLRQP